MGRAHRRRCCLPTAVRASPGPGRRRHARRRLVPPSPEASPRRAAPAPQNSFGAVFDALGPSRRERRARHGRRSPSRPWNFRDRGLRRAALTQPFARQWLYIIFLMNRLNLPSACPRFPAGFMCCRRPRLIKLPNLTDRSAPVDPACACYEYIGSFYLASAGDDDLHRRYALTSRRCRPQLDGIEF